MDPRICVVCGRSYTPSEFASRQVTCAAVACQRERNVQTQARRRAKPKPAEPAVERLAALLRRDPDLESWQLRERGYDGAVIAKARKLTGIQSPRDFAKALAAALREAAPETYRGDAEAARRWR